MEQQARIELSKKIEDVNSYLQHQVETRSAIDKMRDQREKEMKNEFEKTRKDMKVGAM